MSITDVTKDPEALTLTVTADYPAPVERVWQVLADPRRLERWWGPTHPATFVEHDLTPGGRVTYYLTSPEGERYHGIWRIVAVDPPTVVEFEDSFADSAFVANADLPTTRARITLTATEAGTRFVVESRFPSREAMEQLTAMGMEEGRQQALGQIDALLGTPPPPEPRPSRHPLPHGSREERSAPSPADLAAASYVLTAVRPLRSRVRHLPGQDRGPVGWCGRPGRDRPRQG